MGEETIAYINERGSVVIDKEIRELMEFEGEKAKIRVEVKEVIEILDENGNSVSDSVKMVPGIIGVFAFNALRGISWARLKDGLLRAHPVFKYPLSKVTASKIAASWLLTSLLALGLLAQNGALNALAAGNPTEWTGLLLAVSLGVSVLGQQLPTGEETLQALLAEGQEPTPQA